MNIDFDRIKDIADIGKEELPLILAVTGGIFLFISLVIIFTRVMALRRRRKGHIVKQMHDIDFMKGDEFEEYCDALFHKAGFSTSWRKTIRGESATTQKSRDKGADLIVSKDGITYAVQCKRYGKGRKVGISAVQQVVGSLPVYKAQKSIVITNSVYTKDAEDLARAHGTLLINRYGLQECIDKKRIVGL